MHTPWDGREKKFNWNRANVLQQWSRCNLVGDLSAWPAGFDQLQFKYLGQHAHASINKKMLMRAHIIDVGFGFFILFYIVW